MLTFPVRAPRPHGLALAAMALIAALASSGALAQPAPTPSATRPDPIDAAAPVPAPALPRALSQYRPLRDEAPTPWREANDTVTRIGGWRVYTREANQPEPPAAPASGARP